jgi:hypothetical protein
MAYTQVTLSALITQIQTILDDPSGAFYVTAEVQYAIYEALRVFGALTSAWRQRGVITIGPQTPWYDLSTLLPTLRSRSWTLNQLCQQMQYMLLENPSGVAGTGMSGQLTVNDILTAIQRVRNSFVIDVKFPFTIHPNTDFAVTPPDGLIQLPNTTVYLHRLSLQDGTSGAWSNLWREDAWATDHNNQLWTLQPGSPVAFSQSENAPLSAQLVPAPVNASALEAITVDSLEIDITNPNATLNIPDEWVHGVLYGALASIFSGGQTDDVLRYQYCAQRYQQAVDMARTAKSVIRLQLNGIPLPLDTLANIDAGFPYWRNQPGPPQMAAQMYDILAFAGIPDQAYSVAVDVVAAAPLPALGDPIQVGPEDIPLIVQYALSVLLLKSGGKELQETLEGLDNFTKACVSRNQILAVKARYFQPTFSQWQFEESQRPDRMERKATTAA